jgi:protein-tyrosine phosphatase
LIRSGHIARRYGRKAGLLRHFWALTQYHLGLLRRFRRVDWRRAGRLVFVCQGNICRSAYAEAVARRAGLDTASFGLAAADGSPAHPDMVRLAGAAGLDLAGHRARGPSVLTLSPADVLLGLEVRHARALAELARSSGAQLSLLGLWGGRPRPHIEDPYGLSEVYLRTCMGLIDDAVQHIAGLCRPAGPGGRDPRQAGPAPGPGCGGALAGRDRRHPLSG